MTNPSKPAATEAQSLRSGTLHVDLMCEAGDWSGVADAKRVVQQAADAVAAWPGLIKGAAEVAVALSSDAEVAILNEQFRGKPKPTNVLSFPAGYGAPSNFLGDIVLAAETVAREAEEQQTVVIHHIQHLVVHGLLHLLGFDHQTPSDADRMEALEIAILATLGVANPYTGDVLSAADSIEE